MGLCSIREFCQPQPIAHQAGFLVLLALSSGEGHGYAVMRFAEETTNGRIRLPPGTLYRTIPDQLWAPAYDADGQPPR